MTNGVYCVIVYCGVIVYYANNFQPSGGKLSSTKGQPQVVDEYLLVECCEGRVLGPLDPSGFLHVHTSYNQLVLYLSSWISRKSCTRKELESIVGHLAHASPVVKPGKTFMGRLFGLLSGACTRHTTMSGLTKKPGQICSGGLLLFPPGTGSLSSSTHNSGKSLFEVWTDASTSVGCGAVWPTSGRWFQLLWPELCSREMGKVKGSRDSGARITTHCVRLCNLGIGMA